LSTKHKKGEKKRYEISGSPVFEKADLWATVVHFRNTKEHDQVGKFWKTDTCNES
jgi:hypothetical protein